MLHSKRSSVSHSRASSSYEKFPSQRDNPVYDIPTNEKSALFDSLVDILSKHKKLRTTEDDNKICQALQSIKVLLDLKKEEIDFDAFLINTFDSMEYERFNPGDALFHFGDRGDRFYIVLKGSVDVYLKKTEEEIIQEFNQEKPTSPRAGRDSILVQAAKFLSPDEISARSSGVYTPRSIQTDRSEEVVKHKKKKDMLKLKLINHEFHVFSKFTDRQQLYIENDVLKFKKVRNMGPGTYFGELALSTNMLRSATIIASSDLHVATLTKEAYKEVCRDVENSLKMKWRFFSELMTDTRKETLAKFCYSFKERRFGYNRKIFEVGDAPQEVYVIRNGEVQIITSTQQPEHENMSTGLKYFRKQKKTSENKIVNLGPFTFFGEKEALTQENYKYTAVSMSSNTVIYSTTIKTLSVDHERAFEMIFDKHKAKVEFWHTRQSFNLNLKTEEHDDVLQNSVNMGRTGYLDLHSPVSLGKKLRIRSPQGSNTEQVMTFSSAVPSLVKQPHSNVEKELSGSPKASNNNRKMKMTSSENMKAMGTTKMPKKVKGTLSTTQTQFENLFSDYENYKQKKKQYSPTLKEKRKLKKFQNLTEIDELNSGLFAETDSPLSLGIQELVKKGLFHKNKPKEKSIEMPKSVLFIPYEKDIQKFNKTKTLVQFKEVKEKSPYRVVTQDDESVGTVTGKSITDRFGPNGNKAMTETTGTLKSIERSQNRLEVKTKKEELNSPKNNNNAKLNLKKIVRDEIHTTDLTTSQRNGAFIEMSIDNISVEPKSSLLLKYNKSQDELPSPKIKNLIRKKDTSKALQPNTFPVLGLPSLQKTFSGQNSLMGSPYASQLDIHANANASEANLGPPVMKETKQAIIKSKHNMFRAKPRKRILEFNHYVAPSTVKDQSNMRSKK